MGCDKNDIVIVILHSMSICSASTCAEPTLCRPRPPPLKDSKGGQRFEIQNGKLKHAVHNIGGICTAC